MFFDSSTRSTRPITCRSPTPPRAGRARRRTSARRPRHGCRRGPTPAGRRRSAGDSPTSVAADAAKSPAHRRRVEAARAVGGQALRAARARRASGRRRSQAGGANGVWRKCTQPRSGRVGRAGARRRGTGGSPARAPPRPRARLGDGVGERVVDRPVRVPRVAPGAVEGGLAGEVPEPVVGEPQRLVATPRRRRAGRSRRRCRAGGHGSPRPRRRPRAAAAGRRRTWPRRSRSRRCRRRAAPSPDTSPPAPRLAAERPVLGASNESGPRFETSTIGRSMASEVRPSGGTRASGTSVDRAAWRGARRRRSRQVPRHRVRGRRWPPRSAARPPRLGWDCDEVPVADGGEGTLDALGGPNRTTVGHRPARRPGRGRLAARRPARRSSRWRGRRASSWSAAPRATTRSRRRPSAPAS